MTPEEMIAVIQAVKDDKVILYRHKSCLDSTGWTTIHGLKNPNFADFDYRVMESECQPYNVKTLSKAITLHGYAVKRKDAEEYAIIGCWEETGFMFIWNRTLVPYSRLFADWVWADTGEPCGVITDNNEQL